MAQKIIKWLDCGIFHGAVLFSVGFEYEKILAQCKKEKANDWICAVQAKEDMYRNAFGFCSVVTIENPRGIEKRMPIIHLKNAFVWNNAEHHKVLAHEILHLCQFYLPDFIGGRHENECEAYFHSHIMKQCYDVIKTK